MIDAAAAPNVASNFRRLLLVTGVLSVAAFGVACSTHTAVAAGPDPAADADNGSVSFAYGGDALVHTDDYVYVWRRQSLDVTVSVGPSLNGSRVCLSRRGRAGGPTTVGCEAVAASGVTRTVSFDDAGYSASGPTVYQFEVRVFDAANRELVSARSRPHVQITNWSAIDEAHLDEYVSNSGFVNASGSAIGTDGQNATTVAGDDPPEPATGADDPGTTAHRATDASDTAATVQPVAPSENAGENMMAPTISDVPDGLSPLPVALLGGGGMLALMGLLYVQRVRDGDDPEPEPEPTHEFVGQAPVQEQTHPDFTVVVQLLVENDGQLKQSDIVEATDWSKAKVSRLLSRMDARGHILKRQEGRQNVIILRDRN